MKGITRHPGVKNADGMVWTVITATFSVQRVWMNRNILVSAAAGSGKTAVLVERIVKIITDKNHPEIGRASCRERVC